MKYVQDGCRYITGHNGTAQWCGAAVRDGSSYCRAHHDLCYIPKGSTAEQHAVQHIARLAAATGGRMAIRVAPDAAAVALLERRVADGARR